MSEKGTEPASDIPIHIMLHLTPLFWQNLNLPFAQSTSGMSITSVAIIAAWRRSLWSSLLNRSWNSTQPGNTLAACQEPSADKPSPFQSTFLYAIVTPSLFTILSTPHFSTLIAPWRIPHNGNYGMGSPAVCSGKSGECSTKQKKPGRAPSLPRAWSPPCSNCPPGVSNPPSRWLSCTNSSEHYQLLGGTRDATSSRSRIFVLHQDDQEAI